jgi:hypothetical protein
VFDSHLFEVVVPGYSGGLFYKPREIPEYKLLRGKFSDVGFSLVLIKRLIG